MSRRSFPLNAVDAFLIAARHLNLTLAARELCLTQGAVSRKIAALEAWFGFPLFERHARGLRLSPQGSALLPELQSAFTHLLTVADQARAHQTVIRLKAPTCAMRWLIPRLLDVEREQPELQIALTTTTDHNVNFRTESYDAAIVFGTHMSAGDLLFEEALTPVLSPLRAETPLNSLTFLHPTRDKTDWSLWLSKQENPAFVMHKNQHFDTMDLAITAAIQGLGVAIADETLVEEDIRAGRLTRPYRTSIKTGASYRLVLRGSPEQESGLAAFRTCLLNRGSHGVSSPV